MQPDPTYLHEPTQAFQHLRAMLDLSPDALTAAAARGALAGALQKRAVGRLHRPHPW